MRPSTAVRATGPKITVQYRTKRGKVYELQSSADALSLHFSLDAAPPGSGSWHIEAHSRGESSPPPVDGWGATPAEALKDVARAWNAQSPLHADFDWEAVAKELHGVRAL